MKNITPLILLLILIFACRFSSAQVTGDPNLDQMPAELWNRALNSHEGPEATTTSVITLNNWDNFDLGNDFGEANIAVHPGIPTWFFTAYNMNNAHRTMDGHEWFESVPDFGATMKGDPVVAYDSIGNLYYENMYGGSSVLGIKVIRSGDNGTTWSPSVNALFGNDKNWIACDQTNGPYANYVYTTMTNNGAGAFARSIDHGQSFQNTFNPATQSLPGMMVCVGPNGNIQGGSVYVVTNSGSTFASTYTFYRSTNGGQTFTQMSQESFAGYVGTNLNDRHSVEGMRTRPYPFITADNSYGPHRGRLYLVYASNDPPGNGKKPDIWLRYSDNGGIVWSNAKRVNDDANPQSHHQYHPAVWCDKTTGKLYVQWMDTRDCPTSDSAMIYATVSNDGGATFAPNQQISNAKMKIDCSTCGGGGTPRYQGDYNGIVSNGKVSMLDWTDFRSGTFKSVTAYFPDFAMALDKEQDTLQVISDSTVRYVSVPAVKLYSDTVFFSGYVTPEPVNGTIEVFFRSGNRITSFPGTKPVTIKLTGKIELGNYDLIIEAKGPNGTPVHRRKMFLNIQPGEYVYAYTSGQPDTLCQGSSAQLGVQVLGGTPPYTYQWTPAATLSNPSAPDPIATPLTTTWYKVVVTDSHSMTETDSVLVTVNTFPSSPGPVSGPPVSCRDSIVYYSVTPVPGAYSYSWTVPAGAEILSGQNTPEISLIWGAAGGSISVIAGNSCGNSNPSVIEVSVTTPPLPPDSVSGPGKMCAGGTAVFSVPEQAGETYSWTVPPDASIVSGQGTAAIQVVWGNSSGVITVAAVNACGSSNPVTKGADLVTIPGPAGIISGPDTVCSNHQGYIYTVPPIANAESYNWGLPPGASIVSGMGTNSITLFFNSSAESGNISVTGQNNCGPGAESTKGVTVKFCAGVDEKSLSGVKIYPNPATGEVTIGTEGIQGTVRYELSDLKGVTVLKGEWKIRGEQKLDLRPVSRGVYILKITTEKGIHREKLILE